MDNDSRKKELWVGIDVGGTFTDLVMLDPISNESWISKVASSPPHYSRGVLDALARVTDDLGSLKLFLHGTTVHLNAFLERKGERAALVTTRGFGDAYAMRRGNRTRPYDLHFRYPEPLIPRDRIFEVGERMSAAGKVLSPLTDDELNVLGQRLKEANIQAIAVCLLHSYANPEHETRIRNHLEATLPGAFITCSQELSQEWREYERLSTTAINAYVSPILRRYLDELGDALEERGYRGHVYVMRSNGGLASAKASGRTAALSLMSGPVGGNVASRMLGRKVGEPNLICIDMGGTSFETSLVVNGESGTVNSQEVSGFHVQSPMVDIHTIGAGGGSIAWNDGGLLRVGPQSAGSSPGPAAYALGGTDATVTDANVVLGRLNPARPFGGTIALDRQLATEAVTRLGKAFGLEMKVAAEGILDIVNENMANAIRTMTVRRGMDPRHFALVAFGGAGPMHAAFIAKLLGMRRIIVPNAAGAFSAWGMLETDVRHDVSCNYTVGLNDLDVSDLVSRYRSLEETLANQLSDEGLKRTAVAMHRSVDIRYLGQEYTLTLPLPFSDDPAHLTPAHLKASFDDAYQNTYGHKNPAEQAEIVNLRVHATGSLRNGKRVELTAPSVPAEDNSELHDVIFDRQDHPTRFLHRDALIPGELYRGPIVVEELSCTTVVPPGFAARVDPHGNLVLDAEGE